MKIEVKTCYTGGMSLLITSGGYNKQSQIKKHIPSIFKMKISNENKNIRSSSPL